MVKLFTAILFCVAAAVVQSQNAAPGQYPSHVGLHITGGRFGEGVVLNANHILTVAQNVFQLGIHRNVRLAPGDITVSPGIVQIPTPPQGALPVIRIYAHDHYNFHTGKFNVAVLRLQGNLVFEQNVPLPIVFPVTFHNRIVPESQQCQTVGYLQVGNNRQLTVANLPVFNRQQCNSVNSDIRGTVFDEHICVGAPALVATNCNFNDGAAFYCHNELVALRTIGLQCNQANSPGVFVQTRWFQEWIPRQFNRTDNPLPGPVPPPGVIGGASTVILSTVTLFGALLLSTMVL